MANLILNDLTRNSVNRSTDSKPIRGDSSGFGNSLIPIGPVDIEKEYEYGYDITSKALFVKRWIPITSFELSFTTDTSSSAITRKMPNRDSKNVFMVEEGYDALTLPNDFFDDELAAPEITKEELADETLSLFGAWSDREDIDDAWINMIREDWNGRLKELYDVSE